MVQAIEYISTLSTLLSNYRTKNGYTKTMMAEHIGITIQNYVKIESGVSKFVKKKTLQGISALIKIPLELLQQINKNPAIIDISQKQFGDLTALHRLHNYPASTWLCSCKCGNLAIISLSNLLHLQKSCGCRRQHPTPHKTWHLKDGTHLGKIRSHKLYRTNRSGHRGIYKKYNDKWSAAIRIANQTIHLGTYADIKDAIAARQQAEATYFQPILDKYTNLKQ